MSVSRIFSRLDPSENLSLRSRRIKRHTRINFHSKYLSIAESKFFNYRAIYDITLSHAPHLIFDAQCCIYSNGILRLYPPITPLKLRAKMAESSPILSSAPDATNRRRSGRVVSKPVFYAEDEDTSAHTNGSSKRKRTGNVEEDGNSDASEESEDDFENKQPRKSNGKKTTRKPANKKPKTVQGATKLAMRPAVNGSSRSSKPKKSRARESIIEEGSLYGN